MGVIDSKEIDKESQEEAQEHSKMKIIGRTKKLIQLKSNCRNGYNNSTATESSVEVYTPIFSSP